MTTYSGQKIFVHSDGGWSYDVNYAQEILNSQNNYFESITDLNTKQKEILLSLIKAAEFKEVNFAIYSDDLDYKIARKEVELYDVKVKKDKSLQNTLKAELFNDKINLRKFLKYYKESAENLSLIYSLNRFSFDEKVIYIKELSQVYDIELPVDLFQGSQELSIVDVQKPLESSLETNLDTLITVVNISSSSDSLLSNENDVFVDLPKNARSQNGDDKNDIIQQPLKSAKATKNISKSIPVIKNPLEFVFKPTKCVLQNNVKNKKIELVSTYPKFLCGHIPPKAKQYFRDSNLLEVESIVSKSRGQIHLEFLISISNRDAAKNYGMITKNSLIKLIDVKNNHLNLNSKSASVAVVEPETGKVIYNVKVLLSKEHIKFLSNNPLDSLGIMWSSGFETYTIYNVDVIMHQLFCVKNSKKIN